MFEQIGLILIIGYKVSYDINSRFREIQLKLSLGASATSPKVISQAFDFADLVKEERSG